AQRRLVERAAPDLGAEDVVDVVPRIELVQKPETLLRERQRELPRRALLLPCQALQERKLLLARQGRHAVHRLTHLFLQEKRQDNQVIVRSAMHGTADATSSCE